VSPNPSGFSDYVSFHWTATGFPNYSAVTCNDNKGWVVNQPYTGTVYEYAGADYSSNFTWTVTCSDADFYGSYSVAVTYYPPDVEGNGADEDLQGQSPWWNTNNSDCNAGRRKVRYQKVKLWQALHLYTYWTYYEEVRFCYNAAHTKITWFRRDRWTGATNVGWTFDGHVNTNCGPADEEHCTGKVGAYSETATTEGHYHVIVRGIGFDKYPCIWITAHADGGTLHGWTWGGC
jgi:hypothetical protein